MLFLGKTGLFVAVVLHKVTKRLFLTLKATWFISAINSKLHASVIWVTCCLSKCLKCWNSFAGIQSFHIWAFWPRTNHRRHPRCRWPVDRPADAYVRRRWIRRRKSRHSRNGSVLPLAHLQCYLWVAWLVEVWPVAVREDEQRETASETGENENVAGAQNRC